MMIAALAAAVVLPLVALRRRTLVACYGYQAAVSLFAWLLWRRLPDIEPFAGAAGVAVLHVVIVSLFVARGRDVRWSANRAAAMAAIVYALAIPAMLHHVLDGDEPFYLLITESVVKDHDLDLANQYRTLRDSQAQRVDLVPQPGDPRGEQGEQYSRHEPFLALLMVPGYLLAGLYGALATIALFGALLVRSTMRWMEEEGISEAAVRGVFPLFAFAPPLLFYATRIWPEVPAAFFFVEALRNVRRQRPVRWLVALFGLVMLKLRFVLVAAALTVTALRRHTRMLVVAMAVIVTPLLVMWLISGSATNVHSWRELIPSSPVRYVIGLFGLLFDGMSGIAFQAPFYLLGIAALFRWREMPAGFRGGMLASSLYILLLLPRMEWFGGWAPPLRYVVFLMPVLALGAAALWDRVPASIVGVISIWTIGVAVHGLSRPWRLFHIANGENPAGEFLSHVYAADFSRLFPSFIRVNDAAWVVTVVAIVFALPAIVLARFPMILPRRGAKDRSVAPVAIALFALLLGVGFRTALQPASHVEFEDAHVQHHGGKLSPDLYTVMRVAYRGGWVLGKGDSVSFLAREGTWRLDAITGLGAMIELAGRAYRLEPSREYQSLVVTIPRDGRVTLRCVDGAVNLDRMSHE